MDFLLPGLATAGLNVLGGYFGSKAATEAANIQSAATTKAAELQAATTREALALQERLYNQSRQDLMPWLTTGRTSLGRLSHLMGLEREPSAQDMPLAAMTRPSQPNAGAPVMPTDFGTELDDAAAMYQRRPA